MPEDIKNYNDIMMDDISPDANLAQIKASCAELIQKSNKLTKSLVERRRELGDKKRVLMSHERHHANLLNSEFMGKKQADRLDKDGKTARIETIINGQEATQGIYEEIAKLSQKVDSLETVQRNNKLVAERVNDMLVAQTTMEKIRRNAS